MGIQFDGINNEIKSQTKIDFPGSVGVAGTLTYEDVTNVDSVGLITARTGIKIGPTAGVAGTFFADGSYVTAGVVTATTFYGSGANLTGITQVGGATGADFNDNVKLRLGTGNDLEVFHDASHSRIHNNTGLLLLECDGTGIEINSGASTENMAKFLKDGAVELYHNNVKRFETDTNGVRVVAPEGEQAILRLIGDEGDDNNDYFRLNAGGGTLKIQDASNGSSWEDNIVINAAGSVQLHHDDVSMLETESRGAFVRKENGGDTTFTIGSINASGVRLCLDGDSNGDSIGNDYAYLQHNTDGHLIIAADNPAQNGQIIFASGNAAQRAKFNASGHFLPVSNNTYDLGTSSEQWKDFYLSGSTNLGNIIRTNVDGGGHMYHKNNSQGANYSSHFQTYLSSNEGGTTQTHIHYYHGGYSELLYQGNSSIRTRSGGGVEFRNGNSTKIGTFDPDGLKFGTDTAAANAIDDYEEGSWTPTAQAGASGIVVYASRYTKIGNKVFIDFRGYLTGTSNSDVRIGGLPYANLGSDAHNIGPVMHNGFDYAGGTEPVATSYITGTNSYFQLYYSQTNSNGWDAVSGNDTGGDQFITSLTYFTS